MRVYKNYTKKIAYNYLIDSGVKGCFIVYYFEARYYRAPTFISRDPLMNEKPWLTPYHYCSNNPVGKVDPSGMSDDWYEDVDGNAKWDENVSSQADLKQGERYIGKTAEWIGKTEQDEQYRYHGDENGNISRTDISNTVVGERKIKTTKLGINISFGGQIGGRVQAGHVKFQLEGNINSINLLEGSISKTKNTPFSIQGYIFDNMDIHGNRGVSIPFILSYDYSYKAKSEQILPEHSVHSINVLGYQKGTNASSGFKISVSLKFILGIEVYFESINR